MDKTKQAIWLIKRIIELYDDFNSWYQNFTKHGCVDADGEILY